MWGFKTDHGEAGYWPFGHLLAKFHELAMDNILPWPLHRQAQWRNLALVKKAMADTFAALSDTEEIASEYELFLELTQYCDWEAMVLNRNIYFVEVYLLWGEIHRNEWIDGDKKVYCDGKPVKTTIEVEGPTRADAIATINRSFYEPVTPDKGRNEK